MSDATGRAAAAVSRQLSFRIECRFNAEISPHPVISAYLFLSSDAISVEVGLLEQGRKNLSMSSPRELSEAWTMRWL
jgi:hypothetical protein